MADSQSTIVTRFAPSPTGFLHIGGARTALYNWLFARRFGGQFLLRIEDTDRKRHSEDAVAAITEGLKWLGLDWDGDAVSQFSRINRHAAVANELLAGGHAYKCFASQDELQAAREKAQSGGKTFKGDLWRDRDPAEAPTGASYTIRLKMPREGSTIIDDKVQGRVEVSNNELDDMIILRSDGTPTYMLSVVVDDHDMGVTHVIRGDDHLNNTFRQNAIYLAMGWPVPIYAHIPLIHGADGKKLSKRHGALGVEAYRDMGYLPEALRNYLLRLGWSHGDDEIISTSQAIEWFNLENIGASASRFDFDKLDHLNSHYINQLSADKLLKLTQSAFEETLQRPLNETETARITKAAENLASRATKLPDIIESGLLFCDIRPLKMTEKAAKTLNEDAKLVLKQLSEILVSVPEWTADQVKQAIHTFSEESGLKLGKVMQPVRAALTGGRPSGDLIEIMEILGQNETLARLKDQIIV